MPMLRMRPEKLEEVKRDLAKEIYREMICMRISQKRIAKKLGTSQANVSRVV
jgi:predicted transcriptional regulator